MPFLFQAFASLCFGGLSTPSLLRGAFAPPYSWHRCASVFSGCLCTALFLECQSGLPQLGCEHYIDFVFLCALLTRWCRPRGIPKLTPHSPHPQAGPQGHRHPGKPRPRGRGGGAWRQMGPRSRDDGGAGERKTPGSGSGGQDPWRTPSGWDAGAQMHTLTRPHADTGSTHVHIN